MTPSQYLARYHNLAYVLDNDVPGKAHVSRYQLGASGAPWNARGAIFEGIARDLNRQPGQGHVSASNLPTSFSIEGTALTRKGIVRAFMGKASPDELADVIWLAHRYGLITNPARPRAPPHRTVDQYVADFLGLDCNAFVGNYCGLDPETPIQTYTYGARRSTQAQVLSGDIVVSNVYVRDAWRPEHIALTEGFNGNVLTIVEWGTEGQRHHISQHRVQTRQNDHGALFYEYVSLEPAHHGLRGRKYFHAPPCVPIHRGHDIQRPD